MKRKDAAPAETAIDFAAFDKPEKSWPRDAKLDWVRARFPDAQVNWVVYRLDPMGAPARAGEVPADAATLEMDEAAWARQYGAGKYRRELRVRSVRGSFIVEDFAIAAQPIVGDVYSPPAGVDRISALESKLDSLAARLGAVNGAASISVGGANLRELLEVARLLQPPPAPPAAPVQGVAGLMETLIQVKRMARDLYGAPRREERDDADDDSGGFSGMLRDVLSGILRPGGNGGAGGNSATPNDPPRGGAMALPPAPPGAAPEPFPGAAAVAISIQRDLIPQLPPTFSREGLTPEVLNVLADGFADAIESGLGDPIRVAERFRTGAALASALVSVAPALEQWRGLLAMVGERFCTIQLAPDDPVATSPAGPSGGGA